MVAMILVQQSTGQRKRNPSCFKRAHPVEAVLDLSMDLYIYIYTSSGAGSPRPERVSASSETPRLRACEIGCRVESAALIQPIHVGMASIGMSVKSLG